VSEKAGKNLPKRTGAPAHAARRQRSWARGEARHARNLARDQRREAENRAFVSAQGAALGFAPLVFAEGPRRGALKPPSEQARALRRLVRRHDREFMLEGGVAA
jgi:hypothetical protein